MSISRFLTIAILSAALMTAACSSKGSSRKPGDADEDSTIPTADAGGALKDVYFDFDSAALSETAKSTLRENARWILDNANANVSVEGHCDERGTNEYNMALGERRAKSASDFLRSLGVPATSLSTISYGEEMPLDPGHSESAWSKNRRAHLRTGR